MKKLSILIISIFYATTIFGQTKTNKIESTGNVGIGTTEPGSLLNVGTKTANSPSTIAQFGKSVANGEAMTLSLVNSGGGSNQSTSLGFHNRHNWSPTGKIKLQQVGSETKARMHFYTYNSGLKNRMTLDENVNLGIGNPSPNAALDIKREGTALEIDHTKSGGHSMIKFNSVVNNGSDKAFILFQDETSNSPGTGAEDVRLTMGVFNDFRSWHGHSDELWFQGGGRLVQNVGKWDSELNTIIGTPSSGITGGYEWRVDNIKKMWLSHSGQLSVAGTILAKEVLVSTDKEDWPDFVFEENYRLKDLSEVEEYIKTNGHLPDIPSATKMEEQGVNLAEMNKLLLQKIEELTLHAIKQQAEVERMEEDRVKEQGQRRREQEKRKELESEVKILTERLEKIEELMLQN